MHSKDCSLDAFEFVDNTPAGADLTISESLKDKLSLLRRFASALSFPHYFGENWDALVDCLSDWSWTDAPEVVVHHASLPSLTSVDLGTYMEVLCHVISRMRDRIRPKLRITFLARDMDSVASALRLAN